MTTTGRKTSRSRVPLAACPPVDDVAKDRKRRARVPHSSPAGTGPGTREIPLAGLEGAFTPRQSHLRGFQAKPIVERADDALTNPALRLGKKGPYGWQRAFTNCDAGVFGTSPAGTTIQPTHTGHIDLQQEIRAYPNRRYRLDIHAEPAGHRGLRTPIGQIQPCFSAFKANQEIRSYEPPVMPIGQDAPAIYRAYFQCPEGTGRLQVRLRICVQQTVVVKRIRLVETGDYLPQAHPLAIPPEPWREPPPCLPNSVLLCDGRNDQRGLLSWLQEVFGQENICRITRSAMLKPGAGCHGRVVLALSEVEGCGHGIPRMPATVTPGNCAAVVVDLPPAQAATLHDLLAWSDQTIVIASLQTFTGAAQRSNIRGIRLQDRVCGTDMPAAKVILAGYHTRGFALADDIPYCWNDGQDDFAHRYLILPKPARTRLAEMGIHPSLVTETGQAETRNHPLVLYRRGTHGALIVMDPTGLEAPSAGDDIPQVFDLLWRSALARDTITLGQFAAPAPHYQAVTTDLGDVTKHFDMLEDLSPAVRLRHQGNPPPMWLWPSSRVDRLPGRKTLLIRTGFSHDDWPAVYGLTLWLKHIALKLRVNEPVTSFLQRHLRILAFPIAQPRNWRGCPEDITDPQTDLQPADLAGLIDLATGDERHTVILVPDKARAAILQRSLGPSWPCQTEVVIAPQASDDEPRPKESGVHLLVCKVLLPGWPQPYHASSPPATDLPARLLERLAFGTFGWIIPNRHWRPMQVNMGDLRSAGQVLVADEAGRIQPVRQRRGMLAIPPGATLLGLKH